MRRAIKVFGYGFIIGTGVAALIAVIAAYFAAGWQMAGWLGVAASAFVVLGLATFVAAVVMDVEGR